MKPMLFGMITGVAAFSLAAILEFSQKVDRPGDPAKTAESSIVEPIDYGNGVLYFDATYDLTGARFGKSLAAYIGRAGSNDVVAITSRVNFNGKPAGYFVIVRPKR